MMGRRCEEPHCLQIVPAHLFLSHQDQHLAERLAAEEFEQHHQNDTTATDEALARALADDSAEADSFSLADEDVDYQMALALSRELTTEVEERSFRNVQVARHRFERSNVALEERNWRRRPRGRSAAE